MTDDLLQPMTVDLHERLSEFSYGYGVTREVEKLLESIGLHATPFLPSLLDEGSKGFDVKFERPGNATGILLYPTVQMELDETVILQGHPIRILSVDLAQPWPDIEEELLSLFP